MMEKKKNSIDMTHGALWNKILIFALPLAASSILQQLFNSVDTAVVGNFASSQALAAVGSNSSLIALMINLFIGISLGSNVIISRYIGQGVHKNIKAAIHTAIVVALAGGIFPAGCVSKRICYLHDHHVPFPLCDLWIAAVLCQRTDAFVRTGGWKNRASTAVSSPAPFAKSQLRCFPLLRSSLLLIPRRSLCSFPQADFHASMKSAHRKPQVNLNID